MLHRAYLRTKIEMESTGGWVGSTTATVGLLQRSALHIANVSSVLRWHLRVVGWFKGVYHSREQVPLQYRWKTALVWLPLSSRHKFNRYPIKWRNLACRQPPSFRYNSFCYRRTERQSLGRRNPRRSSQSQRVGSNWNWAQYSGYRRLTSPTSSCRWRRSVWGIPIYGKQLSRTCADEQERAVMEGLPFQGGKLDDISIVVARADLDE